eukprot:719067-Pelagomonas_calceolata.AAC.2
MLGRQEGRAHESSAGGQRSTGPSENGAGGEGQQGRNGVNGAASLQRGSNGNAPEASTLASSVDTDNEEAAQAAQVRPWNTFDDEEEGEWQKFRWVFSSLVSTASIVIVTTKELHKRCKCGTAWVDHLEQRLSCSPRQIQPYDPLLSFPACLQVQALEEQVAAVFDDVTLGDMDPQDVPSAKKKEKISSYRSKLMRKEGS